MSQSLSLVEPWWDRVLLCKDEPSFKETWDQEKSTADCSVYKTVIILKQLISKTVFWPFHLFSMTFSVCQRYVSSAHHPVCSSSLPPDGSLTSAAAQACPAGMALGWEVKHLRVSADKLSARRHRVSLVPINKQNRTFIFFTKVIWNRVIFQHPFQRSPCQSRNKWLNNLKGPVLL